MARNERIMQLTKELLEKKMIMVDMKDFTFYEMKALTKMLYDFEVNYSVEYMKDKTGKFLLIRTITEMNDVV